MKRGRRFIKNGYEDDISARYGIEVSDMLIIEKDAETSYKPVMRTP